jgi:hypothetical protein
MQGSTWMTGDNDINSDPMGGKYLRIVQIPYILIEKCSHIFVVY